MAKRGGFIRSTDDSAYVAKLGGSTTPWHNKLARLALAIIPAGAYPFRQKCFGSVKRTSLLRGKLNSLCLASSTCLVTSIQILEFVLAGPVL